MKPWYDIAFQILAAGSNTHLMAEGLQQYLEDIDSQCMYAGGELRSRQVIASAIVTWIKLKVLQEQLGGKT